MATQKNINLIPLVEYIQESLFELEELFIAIMKSSKSSKKSIRLAKIGHYLTCSEGNDFDCMVSDMKVEGTVTHLKTNIVASAEESFNRALALFEVIGLDGCVLGRMGFDYCQACIDCFQDEAGTLKSVAA